MFKVIVIVFVFIWSIVCHHSQLCKILVINCLINCLIRRLIAFSFTKLLGSVVDSLAFGRSIVFCLTKQMFLVGNLIVFCLFFGLSLDCSWSRFICVNCLWLLAPLHNRSQLSLALANSYLLDLARNRAQLWLIGGSVSSSTLFL